MRALLALLVACGGSARVAEPLTRPEPPPTVRTTQETRASSEQCDRLLDHFLELELAATGKTLDPADKQKHVEATRDQFHEVCDQMPAARVECALRAADLDGFAKCDDTP
jgi:hypothetical protein